MRQRRINFEPKDYRLNVIPVAQTCGIEDCTQPTAWGIVLVAKSGAGMINTHACDEHKKWFDDAFLKAAQNS